LDDAEDRTRRADSEHQREGLDNSESGPTSEAAGRHSGILGETAHLRWTEKGLSGLVVRLLTLRVYHASRSGTTIWCTRARVSSGRGELESV
jgi:hypothetical protein